MPKENMIDLHTVEPFTPDEARSYDLSLANQETAAGALYRARMISFLAQEATMKIIKESGKVNEGDKSLISDLVAPEIKQLRDEFTKELTKFRESQRETRESAGFSMLKSINPLERSKGLELIRGVEVWDAVRSMALEVPEYKHFVEGDVKSRAESIKEEIKFFKDNGLWNTPFAYRISGHDGKSPLRYRYIVPSLYYGKAADSTTSLSAFTAVTQMVMMLDRLYEEALHRQYCRVIAVPDKGGTFPRFLGGLSKAVARAEGGTTETGNTSADEVTYAIKTYSRGVLFNLELLAEARLAPDMIDLYMREGMRSLADAEKYFLWHGNGASTIDSDGSTIQGWTKGLGKVSNVTEIKDNKVALDFAIDARGALGGKKRPQGWRSNALFIFNGDVETTLAKRKQDDKYIYNQNGPIDTLLGRPILYNEEVPDYAGAYFVGNLFFIFEMPTKYRMRFSTEGKELIEKNQGFMVFENATDGMPATDGFTDETKQALVRISEIGQSAPIP